MSNKLAIIAIGGNSLIKDANHKSVQDQYDNTRETSRCIAEVIDLGYKVVITHGNGPQVGFILLRSELAKQVLHEVPLDTCGADTQGGIGYQIQQTLAQELRKHGRDMTVATVVTQVVVDETDPCFQNPSKPIGPFYNEDEAKKYQAEQGWCVAEDSGRGWRRVVPSPMPKEIIELPAIKALIDAGVMVVAVGGGGIPVIRNEETGELKGTAAVIDKDHASAMLANNLSADTFVISTAVDKVYLNFGTPQQQALTDITVADAKRYLEEGHFKPGSMKPKIEAAIGFLEKGGSQVVITSPENLAAALKGEEGTRITA